MSNDSAVDVSPVPLGMKATHDTIAVRKRLWKRRKSLERTTDNELQNIVK